MFNLYISIHCIQEEYRNSFITEKLPTSTILPGSYFTIFKTCMLHTSITFTRLNPGIYMYFTEIADLEIKLHLFRSISMKHSNNGYNIFM